MHIDSLRIILKYNKLENVRPWWHEWNLVQTIYLHPGIGMNTCLQEAKIPECLTKGKKTLIQSEPLKGIALNNFRPITDGSNKGRCLLFANKPRIVSREEKHCRKRSRDTEEPLKIHLYILNEGKTRRKKLAMVWIDYKTSFDMVSQIWIRNSIKINKISEETLSRRPWKSGEWNRQKKQKV